MASTYKSPYERKFGKKHPNNPAERKKNKNKDCPSKESVKQFSKELKATNKNGGGNGGGNTDKTAKYDRAQGVASGLSDTIGKLKQPAAVEQQAAPIRRGKAARSVWDEYNTEDAAGRK